MNNATSTAAPQQVWPADKVERRPITELIAYARNARTHSPEQVDQLAASMMEWGWTNPVLQDEEGVLVAGHGRIMAAQKLVAAGHERFATAPVMTARGWSKAQIKAYRIADNELALKADWSPEFLRIELGELKDLGFNLDLTGFGAGEIAELFEQPKEPTPPNEFAEYDEDIDTEHVCPKCGYAWSGGKTQAMATDEDDDNVS
jgi:hypothetical protein